MRHSPNKSKFLCLVLILSALSCSKEGDSNKLVRISSGISYGFCAGYCEHELEINKDEMIFTLRATRQQGLEDLVCSNHTPPEDWMDLERLVTPAFFDLEEVIGCPDCFDQGREFVEIETTERLYRVELDPTLEAIFHRIIPKLEEIRAPYVEVGGCPE